MKKSPVVSLNFADCGSRKRKRTFLIKGGNVLKILEDFKCGV